MLPFADLDTAWALARDQGLAGWSLRDVASAVGMRAPSLYVYVDSKDELYDAMFADGYRALLARIDSAPEGLPDDEALVAAARLFFDFCVEDPARHQLLFLRTLPSFQPSTASYALADEALERLARLLGRTGLDRPEDVDLWTAVVTGLATQQVSNDPGARAGPGCWTGRSACSSNRAGEPLTLSPPSVGRPHEAVPMAPDPWDGQHSATRWPGSQDCAGDASRSEETLMAGKNKGGREAKKPKADKNIKSKGQTPSAVDPALSAIRSKGR